MKNIITRAFRVWRNLRSLARDERGVIAIEFALLAPVVTATLIGPHGLAEEETSSAEVMTRES